MFRAAKSATSRAQLLGGKENLPSGVIPTLWASTERQSRGWPTLTRSSSPAEQYSLCRALTRGQQLNPWDPGVGAFVYSSSAEVKVWPSREAPEEEGSIQRMAAVTNIQKLLLWVRVTNRNYPSQFSQQFSETPLLLDSHMEEAPVLFPEELLNFL